MVAIIPARGGSKVVPLKNLKELGGKPLIAWTIDAARAVSELDEIFVSTDHPEIARVARAYGVEVLNRPAELARDASTVADMLRYHIRELRTGGETAPYMVLLQPTSPLRLPRDIRDCITRLEAEQLDSIATFVEASPSPYRAWRLVGNGIETVVPGANPWLQRQELPDAYQLNGAVYAFIADKLTAEKPGVLFGRMSAVIMDRMRSLDIDDDLDFLIAETVIKSGRLSSS